MIFSLERRFLVLLLLPVTLILIAAGVAGFCYTREYLLTQWIESVRLNLEKAAHQISMKLDEKLEIISLIAKSEHIPNGEVTQAFLIQQLAAQNGVKFVDVETAPAQPSASESEPSLPPTDGLYVMELCEDFGFCGPSLDTNALDRSLRIVKMLGQPDDDFQKRLIVRVAFDSFLETIKAMSREEGNYACLVTSTGHFLAHTDKSASDRRRLGDDGNELEKKVLGEIRTKGFGTVFGQGHPPDYIVGFHKIPSISWYIVFFSRGNVLLQPIVEFRFYYLVVVSGVILTIVLLIRLTTRSVARSIGSIAAAAEAVERGDYAVKLSEDRSDEIGALNGSFNRMVLGLKQRDLIEQTFGRYVDRAIAVELMNRPEALRLGGEKRTVTIMMSDLRNFTPISEKLEPEVVIKMLNRYFARMIAIIERYSGIIVDFYGDSILVFFNGIQADVNTRALDAVKCGLEMQREVEHFLRENLAEGLPEVTMGIGIHTGEVVVGNIGTESRAKYGIVGSDVNLTDRIQATASGGKVVISERTYACIADSISISHGFTVCLKGVEDQKKLYEVDAYDGDEVNVED